MRILITNDDGVGHEGICALQEVAARFGEAIVIAPDRDRSGVSQAITLSTPLRVRAVDERGTRWAVLGGTPTDCVYLGLHHVMRDEVPGLVLSGINAGQNLGWDVLYSGTAAAAREGVLQGIPAVAFSLLPGPDGWPYRGVDSWIEAVIEQVIENPPPAFTYLNVNIPNPDAAPIRGLRTTCLGQRFYSKEVIVRTDPRGGEYMWIGGQEVHMPDMPGSDCNCVRDGYVSVTPLGCDGTDRATLEARGDWRIDR